jgi:hypothetical protein
MSGFLLGWLMPFGMAVAAIAVAYGSERLKKRRG